MKIFLVPILGILLLGCSVNKNLKVLRYSTHDGKQIILTIPKGYVSANLLDEGIDDRFGYKDSSVIYITCGSLGGANYDNIKDAGKQDSLEYMQAMEGTFILSGIDKNGLYWKNHFYGRYDIGYINVSKDKKALYDKCVDSLMIIKQITQ